jgi:hypothetical protein
MATSVLAPVAIQWQLNRRIWDALSTSDSKHYLLACFGLTIPSTAASEKSWTLKGACSKGNIAESDGVQARPSSGMMSTKNYFSLMKRAKANRLTLGSDGFLWATQPLQCDSVAIVQMEDYAGHTMVTFQMVIPVIPSLALLAVV